MILDDAEAPVMVMNQTLHRFSRGKPALTQDMNETAFALLHSGGQFGKHGNSWDLLENDGEGEKQGWRLSNFVDFMRYVKEIFHLEGIGEFIARLLFDTHCVGQMDISNASSVTKITN